MMKVMAGTVFVAAAANRIFLKFIQPLPYTYDFDGERKIKPNSLYPLSLVQKLCEKY